MHEKIDNPFFVVRGITHELPSDMLPLPTVCQIAGEFGWEKVQYNPHSAVIGFKRGGERVNVYYSTGTHVLLQSSFMAHLPQS